MINHKRTTPLLACALLLVCTLSACRHDGYTPKPYAYLRLDMPEASYARFDSLALPFSFERNAAATVRLKKRTPRDEWVDLEYPQWEGVVFLSYKHLHGLDDLRGQVDTSIRLVETHYNFASGIDERVYNNPTSHVYGTVYQLRGRAVASPCQFWVTDSTRHFLRGALYLNHKPNNDSLAPVIDYIRADITRMIETIEWK